MVLAQTLSDDATVFYLIVIGAFVWWTWLHAAMASRLKEIMEESRHQTVLLKRIAEKAYGKKVGELDEPTVEQAAAQARRQG